MTLVMGRFQLTALNREMAQPEGQQRIGSRLVTLVEDQAAIERHCIGRPVRKWF
jgi:hypothetical protein